MARCMGARWWAVLGAAVLAIGCVAEPLPTGDVGVDPENDGGAEAGTGGVGGGTGGMGGEAGTDGAMDDMALEPEPDMLPADMGTGGMGGMPDIGFDEGVGGGEVVDPPTSERVAVTRRGADTFFVWVDAEGQLVSLEVDDDARIVAGPTVIAVPDVAPERVVAREVGGHPWIAYGGEGRPVVLFQVDLPQQTRVVLDELQGAPLLAPAGDGVLVVARTPDDELAWQRVSNELEVEPRVVDAFELGTPDDAAAVPAGVVLLFGDDGQCVQLSDDTWRAIGTFVCPTGPGRILSDGQRPLVSRIYTFGLDQSIGVTALYEATDDYRVSFFEVSLGTAFPNDGAQRPVVGGRIIDGTRRLVASVVGPYETWDTVDSWPDITDWPFGRVRAMARRTLPDRTQAGTCEDGGRCNVDDDCDSGTCSGAAGDQHLVALDFRASGRPVVRTWPMRRRSVGAPSYGIRSDAQCIPVPELCDGADQDCDDRIDDGRCCRGDARVEYRWQTPVEIAHLDDDPDAPYEIVVGDVELNNAYRLMYRLRGTQRWEGKTFSLRQLGGDDPDPLGITVTDAVNGRYLLAAGGVTGLVAQQWVEGGVGDWAIFMKHPSRQEDDFPPRPVAPLGCDEVLAADTLNHRSVRGGNPAGEQFLVVCPDKIVRVHAVVGGENVEYGFDQFGIPTIEWATIHRSGAGELEILVGFRVPDEGLYAVRSLAIEGGQNQVPEPGFLPSELDRLGITDALWPIHRHPVTGRSPIQVREASSARLAFDETDADGNPYVEWRDVLLAPDPLRTEFSPASYHIYSTGRLDALAGIDVTGWWAADVTGNGGVYNLWSTEPVFTVAGEVAYWYVSKGSYGNDDRNVSISRYDVVIVNPTDDTARNWRMVTRETRCTGP